MRFVALLLLLFGVGATGCQSEPVSTTTVTAANVNAVALERSALRRHFPVCKDLPHYVDVGRSGAIDDIDRWAACASLNDLEHETIMLVGDPAATASMRIALLRDGIHPLRIVTGTVGRGYGFAPRGTWVEVDLTSSETIRNLP
jgi:hypothetical protein